LKIIRRSKNAREYGMNFNWVGNFGIRIKGIFGCRKAGTRAVPGYVSVR
jgi:hypothetical protein